MPDTYNESNSASQIHAGEILSAATLRVDVENALKNSKNASLTYSDKTIVSAAALRSAAYTATYEGGTILIKFNTPAKEQITSSNFPVGFKDKVDSQGWLTINPLLVPLEDRQIKLGVYTSSDKIAKAKTTAQALFKGKIAVVSLQENGSFGMDVAVTAKADLSGMDTSKLAFYYFDSDTQIYTPSLNQTYTVDEEGYLKFTTNHGGFIVISEQKK